MKKILLLFVLLIASAAVAQGPSTPITYPVSDPTGLVCTSTYALYQGRLFVCSANHFVLMPTVSNSATGFVNYPFISPAATLCAKNGTQDPPLQVFNGVVFSCQSNAYTSIGGGGGGSPGGTNGQFEYNNGGTFGGVTLSGDITVVTSTGVATLATVNAGSGACGDSTHVCAITTDAKGRVLSQTATAIAGGGGAVASVFGRTGAVVAASNDYSFSQLSGSASNAQLPSAISVTTVTASGAVTGSSFVGVSAGGAGNNWLAAEGTDPGTKAAGKDLLYADSATHTFLMSLNNGTLQQVLGSNLPTSAGSSFTLDMSAAATSALKPPAAAGATPTAQGAAAFDTTTNTLVCGDGTNTTPCIETYLIGGLAGSAIPTGSTQFGPLQGLGAGTATETLRLEGFPLAGILYNLCIQLDSAQPTIQTLTVTARDHTLGSTTAGTSLSFVVAASSAAGVYCDTNIAHAVTISTSHTYDVQFTQSAGGSSLPSGAVSGISAIYRPHR